MKTFPKISAPPRGYPVVWICALVLWAGGCQGWQSWYRPPKVPPLGTQSDAIWQRQEASAEASDFVVYQHEFELNGTRLNTYGEDHVKAIAARLLGGCDFPVVVERSTTSERPDSEFKYPVHVNPQLDMQRRDIIVRSLAAMNVTDAEQRVMVAPPLAAGYTSMEAIRAYYIGINPAATFGAGRGGFGGAWFGAGGFVGGGAGGFVGGGTGTR